MTYYDRNQKKIRQGDILYFEYGNGSKNVLPVTKKNGELGIESDKEFIPLSKTCIEYARLKRPHKKQ